MDTGKVEMNKPKTTIHDAMTGVTETREMTDDEYAALVESGWTETAPEETPTE